MTYYYCGKIGNLAGDCRSRRGPHKKNTKNEGKNKIFYKEEVRKDFNKVWIRKTDKNKEIKFEEVESSLVEGETSMIN